MGRRGSMRFGKAFNPQVERKAASPRSICPTTKPRAGSREAARRSERATLPIPIPPRMAARISVKE